MRNIRLLVLGANLSPYKSYRKELEEANIFVDAYSLVETEQGIRLTQYDFISIVLAGLPEDDVLTQISLLSSIVRCPIIPLLDLHENWSRMDLLRAGAAVCLVLPMTAKEFAIQINSLHKIKNEINNNEVIAFGPSLIIDKGYKVVYIDGKSIRLTRQEFALLDLLSSSPEKVFSKKEIYGAVWSGPEDYWSEDAVKSCIRMLRKKLGAQGQRHIQNVHGDGYVFSLGKG